MVRTPFLRDKIERLFVFAMCILASAGNSAFAQEKANLPKRNEWVFTTSSKPIAQGWLFITIRPEKGVWVIDSLERNAPDEISKDSTLEPFIVSADFQHWSNYYKDNVVNCDSFAVQDSLVKNVCFSLFASKNNTQAFLGVFFGGNGTVRQRYDEQLVNAAINSIDPEDALRRLERIEKVK